MYKTRQKQTNLTGEALIVESFVEQFGETYRPLAYYASLPLILTPDLISFLRSKFLIGKVPWIAEADLLLSDLCRPIGYEQYAMHTPVRAFLLAQVRGVLGRKRMEEIAHFILRYIRYLSESDPALDAHGLRSQQWAAMVYLDNERETVVREIAESFRGCLEGSEYAYGAAKHDLAELQRLVTITNELSSELRRFPELLEYARDVGQILAGADTGTLDDRVRHPTRVLDIRLPSPLPLAKPKTSENEPVDDVDFGQLLDQFEREQATLEEGEVVRGVVIAISERGIMVDFGYKKEGIVNPSEVTVNGVLTVKVGDEVEVLVKSMETADGFPILSVVDAQRVKAWDDLEEAYREGSNVKGRVVDRIKGGLRVDIDGIAAFLPGSQVDVRPVRNLDAMRNQIIEAKVIKLNRKRTNVVLSRKAVIEQENTGRREQILQQIEEDIVVEGQIKNLTDYGAFVDLGGVDGLLHVTDMSWGRLQNPNELFHIGDNIQVKVLKFDRERERVSLGYKQLLPDPWSSVEERFPVGTRVKGKVASVAEYGAFVELEPGIEGLVHVSEMSWSKRVKHPSKVVNPGDAVEVEVLSVDPGARRISLGMKQVQENPWRTLHQRYWVGTRVHGRVRNLTDFGAFIEIEDGVDGLVHVSDISWSRRIKHPSEVLKKGQEIDAVITSIDTENRRLSLSIKDLEPSAWERFINEHRPGDVVRGKVARFANFGAFIELDDNLEGLCHISELSEERVARPEDVVQLGQEMDFKILRIDPETKKIGLSARAVGKDEPIMGNKIYSSEAGGGMASLSELADIDWDKSNNKR